MVAVKHFICGNEYRLSPPYLPMEATFCEARNLVVRLDSDKHFSRVIKPSIPPEIQRRWSDVVEYANSGDFQKVKQVRDVLGAHLDLKNAVCEPRVPGVLLEKTLSHEP